jgi:flagellar protein FliS
VSTSTRESYLATEILTATPQKLRLMLIDGAIRAVQTTQRHWQAGQYDEGRLALLRAEGIVAELLGSLNRREESALVKQIESIYWFVLRSLAEANVRHDLEKLSGVLKVLEVERETWRQVCRQNGDTEVERYEAAEVYGSTQGNEPPMPTLDMPQADDQACSGLSLEA